MNQNSRDRIKPRDCAVSVMSPWLICVDDLHDHDSYEAANEAAITLLGSAGYDADDKDEAGEAVSDTVQSLLIAALIRAPKVADFIVPLVESTYAKPIVEHTTPPGTVQDDVSPADAHLFTDAEVTTIVGFRRLYEHIAFDDQTIDAWRNAALVASRNLWPDVINDDGPEDRVSKMMDAIESSESKYDSVVYNDFIVVKSADMI